MAPSRQNFYPQGGAIFDGAALGLLAAGGAATGETKADDAGKSEAEEADHGHDRHGGEQHGDQQQDGAGHVAADIGDSGEDSVEDDQRWSSRARLYPV